MLALYDVTAWNNRHGWLRSLHCILHAVFCLCLFKSIATLDVIRLFILLCVGKSRAPPILYFFIIKHTWQFCIRTIMMTFLLHCQYMYVCLTFAKQDSLNSIIHVHVVVFWRVSIDLQHQKRNPPDNPSWSWIPVITNIYLHWTTCKAGDFQWQHVVPLPCPCRAK